MPKLSIIIVNYNTREMIAALLESFRPYWNVDFTEVIVIDNSSEDPQTILEDFPRVQWIPMGYNAGFARANNKGIQMAKGEIVLLLNPDVLVEDNAIEACAQRFMTDPYIACGVQLLNPDRSPQISGSYYMKGGLNHLLPLPFLGNIFKWLGEKIKVRKTSIVEVAGLQEVDWINGAFLMVRKEVIAKAGLLDEDFFLYSEEIEWCSRLRKYGSLCIYGDLHVTHLQGESANKTFGSGGKGYYNLYDRKGRQIMISNFVRIRKQFGSLWFVFHLLVYTIDIPIFLLGISFQKLSGKKERYAFSQWQGYCRNLIYVWERMMTILSNRPYFYKAL